MKTDVLLEKLVREKSEPKIQSLLERTYECFLYMVAKKKTFGRLNRRGSSDVES